MSQISFADAEYAGKRKKTRREVFLEEMELVVPWKVLLKIIEPHYTVAGRGCSRVGRDHLQWHIAARPSDIAKLPEGRAKKKVQKTEHRKASVHAKVEHPFRVVRRQFGLVRVRFRGLAKNTGHVVTLFALSNLWMVRKQLMAMTGVVRPQAA
jgi:hypothetical protein